VTCGSSLDVLDMFPSTESADRRFAFLRRVLRSEFPCFIGTIEALRLPAARPAALRCLRLAVPQRSLVNFAPRRTSEPPGPGVGHPVSPSGFSLRKRQDLPSSWGTPIVRSHMIRPTPAGLQTPDHYGAATWPLVNQQQRLPRKVFRSSIAWLSDSLSTLRSARYHAPRKTRFRPLVKRYRTGFPPARFR
jgi:hypothetical protein